MSSSKKQISADFIKIPDPRSPLPHEDILNQFPQAYLLRMNDEVKETIKKIPALKPKLCINEKGYYCISEEKLLRAPYDDFLAQLTEQFGISAIFKYGPRQLDTSLKAQLQKNTEYIFALVPDQQNDKILVLPRVEILYLDNQYIEGRHTHKEFLKKAPEGLLAAGTLYLEDPGLIKYNFRSGHFMVHTESPKKLAELRNRMLEAILFSCQKTLPNRLPFFWQHSPTLLPYSAKDKHHAVIEELKGWKNN